MTLQPALTPEDFEALDRELDFMREDDETVQDWDFYEGFLAALVCTRRAVPADEYWPAAFGDDFRPMAHMEFVWRWQRRWSEVAAALDAEVEDLGDEQAYYPEVVDLRGALLASPPEERDGLEAKDMEPYGMQWARGFLSAVEAFGEDWEPPRDREVAAMLEDALDVIAALLEDDRAAPAMNLYQEDGPPTTSEERADAFGEAIWAVYDLRRLWKSLGPRITAVRKEPQPGRNDPCPCGSGKKFKKCHGG
jgi:uncharacterized protein